MVPYYKVVKIKRETMGLTMTDFGKEVGVTSSTISNFENGMDVSEVIRKSIRYTIRRLEDEMDQEEFDRYSIISESKLIEFETNDELLHEKLEVIMFKCLRLKKHLRDKTRNY